MEITVKLPESLFKTISNALVQYADIVVTVDELKANETFMAWLAKDIPNFYEMFGDDFSNFCESIDEMGFGSAD